VYQLCKGNFGRQLWCASGAGWPHTSKWDIPRLYWSFWAIAGRVWHSTLWQ
jgi:hypothetical protein